MTQMYSVVKWEKTNSRILIFLFTYFNSYKKDNSCDISSEQGY